MKGVFIESSNPETPPPSLLVVMCQCSSKLVSSRADHIPRSVSYAPLVLCCGTFRVGRAYVWEFLKGVGVGLQAQGRTLVFRQEGEAVIDHVFV